MRSASCSDAQSVLKVPFEKSEFGLRSGVVSAMAKSFACLNFFFQSDRAIFVSEN